MRLRQGREAVCEGVIDVRADVFHRDPIITSLAKLRRYGYPALEMHST